MSELDCPFRGLMPYTEKDADYFFGRSEDTEIIVANCLTTRLTVLYGASGVGKSSVLHAGVMRALRERAEFHLKERNCPEAVGIAFSSWRDEPVAALIDRVEQTLRSVIPPDWPLPPRGSRLAPTFRAWIEVIKSDLVLILDQFEEYFIYRDVHDVSFERELAELVMDPILRVNVMLALREDALARLDTLKTKVPALFDNCLRLEHLTRKSAREAIEGPLRLYNQRHAAAGLHVTCEPALIDAVLDQVQAGKLSLRQAGEGKIRTERTRSDIQVRVEAPYLQMVMTRIWREDAPAGKGTLRLATLETKLGGAASIVRTHLDLVMERLSLPERVLASKVFRHLVTPSGTKIAHYVRDLADFGNADPAEIDRLFAKLDSAESRVLRDVTPPGAISKRYEIYHDLLAAPVLDWRHRFEADQRRQADRKRWKRRLWIARVIGLFIIAAASTAVIVLQGENNKANERAKEATARAREADKRVKYLEAQLNSDSGTDNANAVVNKPVIMHSGNPHTGEILSVRYAPEKFAAIVTAGSDKTARVDGVLDPESFVLTGHTDKVTFAMFNPTAVRDADSNWLVATASDDMTARVWERPPPGAEPRFEKLVKHQAALTGLAWSKDGRWLVTTSRDQHACIWDLKPAKPQLAHDLIGHTGEVGVPALVETDGGAWLATPSSDGTARLWRFPSGEFERTFEHGGKVQCVAFDSSGRWLVTGGIGPNDQGLAILWDRASGHPIGKVEHTGNVREVVFHSKKPLFATVSDDGSAKVLDAASSFSTRNGSVNLDSAVKSSDLALLHPLIELGPPNFSAVRSVTFTREGPGILSADEDGKARLWDYTKPGKPSCVAQFKGHTGKVEHIQMDPAGRTFVTTGSDGATLLWRMGRISALKDFRPPWSGPAGPR